MFSVTRWMSATNCYGAGKIEYCYWVNGEWLCTGGNASPTTKTLGVPCGTQSSFRYTGVVSCFTNVSWDLETDFSCGECDLESSSQ